MIPTVDSGNGFLSKVGISASSKVRDEQIQALARTRVESLDTVFVICILKSKLEQIRLNVKHIVCDCLLASLHGLMKLEPVPRGVG